MAECARLVFGEELDIVKVAGDAESKLEGAIRERELKEFLGDGNVSNYFLISMSQPVLREKCRQLAKELSLAPMNLIHPLAFVSRSATLGKGIYIAAQAVVSSNAVLADHCIINFQGLVGHDSQIGQDCIINPGAKISGQVKIGERTLIGANAFIFQGKKIGDEVLIDAMTYIDRDIEARSICSSKNLKVFKRIV